MSGRFRCRFPYGQLWLSSPSFYRGTPLTRNQIALVQRDNIASANLPGLLELSVLPTAVKAVVSEIAGRRPG